MKCVFGITIDAVPPSVNHIYKSGVINGRRMRYLSNEAQVWYKTVSLAVANSDSKRILFNENKTHRVEIGIVHDWRTKKGSVRKKDIDNRIKTVLDGLVRCLNGFKDESVWEVLAVKEHAENGHKTVVKIFEL